jgi:hypothetical protein
LSVSHAPIGSEQLATGVSGGAPDRADPGVEQARKLVELLDTLPDPRKARGVRFRVGDLGDLASSRLPRSPPAAER